MKVGKTETMWVVVNEDDNVVPDTLSYYRKDSIKAFIEYAGNESFEYWKKEYGYSCVKVLVTISRKEEVK